MAQGGRFPEAGSERECWSCTNARTRSAEAGSRGILCLSLTLFPRRKPIHRVAETRLEISYPSDMLNGRSASERMLRFPKEHATTPVGG